MRNRLPLLLLLLFALPDARGQQYVAQLKPDSLERVLLTAKDTQRVNTLNLLVRRNLYMNQGGPVAPGAEAQTEEALRLATTLRYERGV